MNKIKIYPYKSGSFDKILTMKPYNLSSIDVDFDADAIIADVQGWVYGTSTYYYTKWNMIEYPGKITSYKTIESQNIPCLKAIVNLNGTIFEIENYRIKPM